MRHVVGDGVHHLLHRHRAAFVMDAFPAPGVERKFAQYAGHLFAGEVHQGYLFVRIAVVVVELGGEGVPSAPSMVGFSIVIARFIRST